MIIEFAHFLAILALIISLMQFLIGFSSSQFPSIYARFNSNQPVNALFFNRFMVQQSYLNFLFLLSSFVLLIVSFINNDFSVALVARNSSINLPIFYKISAVWGNHEGSILLWGLVLSFYTALVAKFSKSIKAEFRVLIISILALINTWLLSYMLFLSSPFTRMFPIPLQGSELNPLLQDLALIFHPPTLYLGYVGLAVPFACIVTGLLKKELNSDFLLWLRPWTLIPWIFLTAGVGMGSFWAYYELGWGSWWFWDPVENSSFMPWLTATALVHSLIISQKRGSLKNWTIILAMLSFNLSLLGTFLVRSGVITSVHSFASAPNRGLFILIFLAFFVVFSLVIYLTHFSAIKRVKRPLSILARETMMLIGNILFISAFVAVFLGTLYPLLLEALNLPLISIGKPYFNQVFVPLMVPVVFMAALAPWQNWNENSFFSLLYPTVRNTFIFSLLSGIWGYWFWQNFSIALALFLSTFLFSSMIIRLIKPSFLYYQSNQSFRFIWQSFSAMAMQLAHIGVAFFVIGVTISTQFGIHGEKAMKVGDIYQFNGFQIELQAVDNFFGANYISNKASLVISKPSNQAKNSKFSQNKTVIYPEKREYQAGQIATSESAIYSTLLEDLTVTFSLINHNTYGFTFYYQPLIRLIWLGILLMVLGGITGVLDKRFRRKKQNN